MQSKITLIGMYNYDNSLFDDLTFPAGIDRDLAINRILEKSEEFELVYADFNYLKDRIGIWGKLWERTFSKWYEALNIKYDPLHNYDRFEEYEDTKASSSKNSSSSKSESSTKTGSESSSSTTNKISAYDDADFSNKEYEEGEAETSQTGTGEANSSSSSNGSADEKIKHSAHLYGNIGVTTSVQMLREQLDVVEWNLYEHISDIFIDEFCILVY